MTLLANDIDIWLGRRQILHGVDLTAQSGQVTAIIGPNGSGKTTLLRALTGEVQPCSGAVFLNGADVHACSPARLSAMRAVLPQQSVLSFPFTAAEIVGIGLSTRRIGAKDRAPLIAAAHFGTQSFPQFLPGEEPPTLAQAQALGRVDLVAAPLDGSQDEREEGLGDAPPDDDGGPGLDLHAVGPEPVE